MANMAIIGISDWARSRDDLARLADRLEAGEDLPEGDYHLDFPDAARLLAELPPRRLDTLRAIRQSGHASIYAVARMLGRNYSNVHADVQKLLEHALVEKDEVGRVFVPWDDVLVRVEASLLQAA